MPHAPVRGTTTLFALLLFILSLPLFAGDLAGQEQSASNCEPWVIICDDPEPPARVAPDLILDPHHPGFRDITQGSATVTYTTPAYVSRDVERSLSLMFSSGQSQPRGFIQLGSCTGDWKMMEGVMQNTA